MKQHSFEGSLHWSGGTSQDAQGRLKLARSFVVRFKDKAAIEGSSPSVFGGDDSKHSPETLMIASLLSCHHLTYLALCERAGVEVLEYSDDATGTLGMRDGKMRMLEVVLWPRVRVSRAELLETARALHESAHANCFMANSVNFEVRVQPIVIS
jgi:organic hydroperoxide reductase OsmC/OhrA